MILAVGALTAGVLALVPDAWHPAVRAALVATGAILAYGLLFVTMLALAPGRQVRHAIAKRDEVAAERDELAGWRAREHRRYRLITDLRHDAVVGSPALSQFRRSRIPQNLPDEQVSVMMGRAQAALEDTAKTIAEDYRNRLEEFGLGQSVSTPENVRSDSPPESTRDLAASCAAIDRGLAEIAAQLERQPPPWRPPGE